MFKDVLAGRLVCLVSDDKAYISDLFDKIGVELKLRSAQVVSNSMSDADYHTQLDAVWDFIVNHLSKELWIPVGQVLFNKHNLYCKLDRIMQSKSCEALFKHAASKLLK